MRESCTYGTVRGASSNGGPYRNIILRPVVVGDPLATGERADDAKPVNATRET